MIITKELKGFIFWICFVLVAKVGGGEGKQKTCYKVNLVPADYRRIWNYNAVELKSVWERRQGEMKFHILDETGKVLMASNSMTSQVCLDHDKSCYYWLVDGNGYFNVTITTTTTTNENYDEAAADEVILVKEGRVAYDRPELFFPIGDGVHCHHYCGDHQQQLTFVGFMEDEPMLYYDFNNEVVNSLFYKAHDDDDDYEDKKKEDDNEVILKSSCLMPSQCYRLVGSALYVISNSQEGSATIIAEEGSTFQGSKAFGNQSNCGRSHYCNTRPLLGSTRRGIEMLRVASSVSSSDAIADVVSPQYKAACWMIHDDPRQLNAYDYNVIQRYILAVIFYSFSGNNDENEWRSGFDFMTSKHECQWHKWVFHRFFSGFHVGDDNGDGVHCNAFGYVSGIILRSNHLVGTVPFELAFLRDLQYIDFADNSLYGSIPTTLGILQNLRYIAFDHNSLTGSFHESIGKIKTLNFIYLGDNVLTGRIPSLIQEDLFDLDVGGNILSGRIPENLDEWTSLAKIKMDGNRLSGTIPEGISNLTSLRIVYFHENALVGTLPSKILELPRLLEIRLYRNSLTGSIPSWVANDSPLDTLYLQYNQLTGEIPTELSLLGNLRFVQLENNNLSGEIPYNFTNLQHLRTFYIHNNNVTGDSPFRDCQESPRSMEADCDTPQKVACPCCTGCHGIFTSHDDGLVCPSGNLTLQFENLEVGDILKYEILNSAETLIYWDIFSAKNTTHRHTVCVSISGCFQVLVWHHVHKSGYGIKLFINQDLFLEETLNKFDIFELGFSADGTIRKDTCDEFVLCNSTFEANSTKRNLLDKLVRITGAQVFDDMSSSYYNSACKWVNYLESVDNQDEYKYTKLIQHFYLTLLFYETNGNEWTTSDLWVTNTTFCNWYGIQCNSYGIVTLIRLSSNNLRGSLPTEIAELRGLEYILLNDNLITGTLPLEIGFKMTMLKQFNVAFNGLWGSIPEEFGRLQELEEFDASHNRLTSSLPEDIGLLHQLQVFNLFNNTCEGSLPGTLHDLQSLTTLSLGSNLFAGSASRVEKLINLESLDLSQNFFTGNLPLGSSQKVLRVLQLSGNQFRGSIQVSIGDLTSLETLFLYNNLLTGDLPSEIGNLEKLVKLSVSHNDVKGSLPFEMGRLKALTLLRLQDSLLEGSGDLFDYQIEDYIADCGHTFTGAARVECTSCTSCCNVEGDCIKREVTWPKQRLEVLRIRPHRFVFVMLLLACVLLLIPMYAAAKHVEDVDKDFEHCREFQAKSVYKFLKTNSIAANGIAIGTVTIQLLLLSIFLFASDFSAEKNDWTYSMNCPDDSTECEDFRLITYLAWLIYGFVLSSHLVTDFAGSVKMIHKALLLQSYKCGFVGFVVLYITVSSGLVSFLYIYSTGISSTDILKDAVILLFLNEMDEKLYGLAEVVWPIWLKERNSEIKKLLDDKIEGAGGGTATQPSGTNNDNNNDTQEPENTPQEEEEKSPEGADFNLEEGAAGYVRIIREQRNEIHALRNGLASLGNAHTQLQDRHEHLYHSHVELKRAHEELEKYLLSLKSKIEKDISDIIADGALSS